MKINSVAIENYKSFNERQEIAFHSGFNILIGANNAGKSSVFDVLKWKFQELNAPHRSIATVERRGLPPSNQFSKFDISIATPISEYSALIGGLFYLPISDNYRLADNRLITTECDSCVKSNNDLVLTYHVEGDVPFVYLNAGEIFSGVFNRSDNSARMCAKIDNRNRANPSYSVANIAGQQSAICDSHGMFSNLVYRFDAFRRVPSSSSVSSSPRLESDASNLPYCISHLAGSDPHGMGILCRWVNQIFPSIKLVAAVPQSNNSFLLKCSPVSAERRRDDLAIPIGEMGGGIGNVIAILYVVLTSHFPQVIAIDEPNAFLHPRAVRELLTILEAEGSQHQYILTTHSADVLTSVAANSVSLLSYIDGVTTVKTTGPQKLNQLAASLTDMGIRISDLQSKDRVLWVEGQTEELVLPRIFRWGFKERAVETAILRVETTGIFEKNKLDPVEVANIYSRLTTSTGLVPPSLCILLDREKRKSSDCQSLEMKSGGKLRFLKRRMIENYFLHPGAIAAVLTRLGVELAPDSAEKIKAAIPVDADEEFDGALMLKTLFGDLSNATEEFRKTRDVPAIVDWILENSSDFLNPLVDELARCCGFET